RRQSYAEKTRDEENVSRRDTRLRSYAETTGRDRSHPSSAGRGEAQGPEGLNPLDGLHLRLQAVELRGPLLARAPLPPARAGGPVAGAGPGVVPQGRGRPRRWLCFVVALGGRDRPGRWVCFVGRPDGRLRP